jgi:inositol transport system ATP-binding protein
MIVRAEPTSALSEREVATLHRIIRDLKAKGISIVYVTHRLDEVKAICDRYTVLRDGLLVASGNVADVEVRDMVRLMVGREVEFLARPAHAAPGEVVLEVENVCRGRLAGERHATVLRDLSVEVRAGEIVGFAGLVGAGRTELARVIFGADRCDRGVIRVGGVELTLRSPGDGIDAGIVLVPEDRKQQGCFLTQSIRQNMTLPSLRRLSRWKFFDPRSSSCCHACRAAAEPPLVGRCRGDGLSAHRSGRPSPSRGHDPGRRSRWTSARCHRAPR